MTDREPDDLYDALRDRLADFGQEPPAPLWAGIRAQLPPPVAQPQLRPKRKRTSLALLLLLLIMASGAGWHWWHKQSLKDPATASKQTRTAAKQSEIAYQKSKNTPESSTEAAISVKRGLLDAQPQKGATTNSEVAVAANDAVDKATAVVTHNESTLSTVGTKEAHETERTALFATTSRSQQPRKQLLTGRTGDLSTVVVSGSTTSQSARGMTKHPAKGKGMREAAIAQFSPAKAIVGRRKMTENPIAGTPAARQAASSTFAATVPTDASATALNQSASALPVAGGLTIEPENPAVQATASQAAAAASGTGASAMAAARRAGSGAMTSDALSAAELARLQARSVALRLMAGPALAQPRQTSIVPDEPSAIPLSRWAVQIVAGPALTYRQLNTAALAYAITPAITNPSKTQYTQTNVAELERPAMGSGAQVNVRRVLTQHWNLSAGIGYAEYGTRLALQQVRSAALTAVNPNVVVNQDSAITSIHRRDTYRFMTVPLRVGYTWPLAPRWSVGLLAGADVALYLGGTTTEGSACACQTQTWGLTGSPYRRISVGASLGAELRYRLNGRWELLAQPTGTYMLNPLAQSTYAYYRRHLLGGTALLGASYTLP